MTGLEFIVLLMAFAILGLCVTTSLLIVLSVRYREAITAKDTKIADLNNRLREAECDLIITRKEIDSYKEKLENYEHYII